MRATCEKSNTFRCGIVLGVEGSGRDLDATGLLL